MRDTCGCDMGGDCECLCDAVAAYAKACLDKGVCVDWRAPDFCREYFMPCPNLLHPGTYLRSLSLGRRQAGPLQGNPESPADPQTLPSQTHQEETASKSTQALHTGI